MSGASFTVALTNGQCGSMRQAEANSITALTSRYFTMWCHMGSIFYPNRYILANDKGSRSHSSKMQSSRMEFQAKLALSKGVS